MGNPSWGKGFYTGLAKGRSEGLIIGLIITAVGSVGSYVVGKKGGVKGIVQKFRSKHKDLLYEVTADGKDNSGLEVIVGDKIKVLENKGDLIKINKIGDANNPYFVSCDFLSSITDFN